MSDHSESECTEIHEIFSFTTTVLIRNKGSEDLKNWYEKVFSKQYPKSNDFEFEFNTDHEKTPVIEIIGPDYGFTTGNLIALFYSYRASLNDKEKF